MKGREEGRAMPGLEVRELSKSFGRNSILEKISFEVEEGEFCVILGPSGCGKSTLLRLVAGLEAPTAGTISLGGRPVDGLPPRDRDVAFVFQNYALYPHMTAFDNVAFALRIRRLPGAEVRQKVLDVARLLDIEGLLARKPQELSGGERQRVALGRAIVRQPRIFLFDEPLSNLDASLRAGMRVELARLHERLRATILYVTHDQSEAMILGQKIIVLRQGRVQQVGPPSSIYKSPANKFVASFVGSPPMNFIEGRLDAKGAVLQGAGFSMDLSPLLSKQFLGYASQPLTLGIRPEDLHPTQADRALIQGEIEFVEDLGSDKYVHLKRQGLEIVARAPAHLSPRRGETLYFSFEPERLHVYSQDGESILDRS
jgi:multiple sugar transport system ATP-binding protein